MSTRSVKKKPVKSTNKKSTLKQDMKKLKNHVLEYLDDNHDLYKRIQLTDENENSMNILVAKSISRDVRITYNKSIFSPHEKIVNQNLIIIFIICIKSDPTEKHITPYVTFDCPVVEIADLNDIHHKLDTI